MVPPFFFLLFLLSLLGITAYEKYEFAKRFSQTSLFSDSNVQRDFIQQVVKYEGRFHCDGVGIDLTTGMTFDGIGIDAKTLEPISAQRHNFSASSKEGLHLSLLAMAINHEPLALDFFAQSACPGKCGVESEEEEKCDTYAYVVNLVKTKAETLEKFNTDFPGMGGFVPWYAIDMLNGTHLMTPTSDWINRVPSLVSTLIFFDLLIKSLFISILFLFFRLYSLFLPLSLSIYLSIFRITERWFGDCMHWRTRSIQTAKRL